MQTRERRSAYDVYEPTYWQRTRCTGAKFKLTGSYTTIDLIAASTNALNGALLARRPDHYRNFTVVGIILMALLGGLGGGITRDILVGEIPSALTNPAYIFLALAFGVIGYLLAYTGAQLFREGLFQLMTSSPLPWYAIAGCRRRRHRRPSRDRLHPARSRRLDGRPRLHRHHERVGAEAVHPRPVVRADRRPHGRCLDPAHVGGSQRVGGGRDLIRRRVHDPRHRPVPRLGGAPRQGAQGRLQALDGRPMLGRKLAGKSQRELHDLGLTVDNGAVVEGARGRPEHRDDQYAHNHPRGLRGSASGVSAPRGPIGTRQPCSPRGTNRTRNVER